LSKKLHRYTVLLRADEALYRSKREGRNRVRVAAAAWQTD
jgi:GGDEF domain-containing protein